MKKLAILVNSGAKNTRRLKVVSVGANGEKFPLHWSEKSFRPYDMYLCIMNTMMRWLHWKESNIGFDELAKMFLLDCKNGSGTSGTASDSADSQNT